MEQIKDKKSKGVILAVVAAVFWGYMGVPVKILDSANLDTFAISFLRSLIAGIFYLLVCVKKDYKMLKVDFKSISFFIMYSICAFFLTFIAYNIAVVKTSIAIATILLFTSPVWVIVFSYIFFKEKLTKKKLLCIVVTLVGGFLVAKGYDLKNANISMVGVVWGIISGVSFALQVVLAKVSSKRGYNQDVLLAYSLTFTWIFLIPFVNFSNMKEVFTISSNVGEIVLNILIIGFFNTAIANGFYVKCVDYIEASTASIIVSIEPVIASIVAYIAFKEILDIPQMIGIFLVILSIVLLNVKSSVSRDRLDIKQ